MNTFDLSSQIITLADIDNIVKIQLQKVILQKSHFESPEVLNKFEEYLKTDTLEIFMIVSQDIDHIPKLYVESQKLKLLQFERSSYTTNIEEFLYNNTSCSKFGCDNILANVIDFSRLKNLTCLNLREYPGIESFQKIADLNLCVLTIFRIFEIPSEDDNLILEVLTKLQNLRLLELSITNLDHVKLFRCISQHSKLRSLNFHYYQHSIYGKYTLPPNLKYLNITGSNDSSDIDIFTNIMLNHKPLVSVVFLYFFSHHFLKLMAKPEIQKLYFSGIVTGSEDLIFPSLVHHQNLKLLFFSLHRLSRVSESNLISALKFNTSIQNLGLQYLKNDHSSILLQQIPNLKSLTLDSENYDTLVENLYRSKLSKFNLKSIGVSPKLCEEILEVYGTTKIDITLRLSKKDVLYVKYSEIKERKQHNIEMQNKILFRDLLREV